MTAIDTVNVVPATPLGNAGDDIGNNILMGNGVDVSFDDLKQVPIPEDTATYTAVPHEDFVHSMYKHADRILSPKGFKLEGERYRTDKNGDRLFFVHHYRNGDSEMNLGMACRNSYDKSMKAGVGIGAHVMNCSNGVMNTEGSVVHSHRGNVLKYLNDNIILNMYNADDTWDTLRRDRDEFAEYDIDSDDGYALMGIAKAVTSSEHSAPRRLLSTDKEWKSIQKYWDNPEHEYSGGNRTLWAWYNSFTFVFKDIKTNEQMPRHASLHQFCKGTLTAFNGSGRAKGLLDDYRNLLEKHDPDEFARRANEEIGDSLNATLLRNQVNDHIANS